MSFLLRFLPEGCQWRGEQPVPLALAAAECGILLEQPCGGKGVCGKCLVRVAEGAIPPGAADLRVLGDAAVAQGWRLACLTAAAGDALVEVPPVARTAARKSFGPDQLPGPPFQACFPAGGWGIALDLGSTSLAAAVVDLATGQVATSATALNPQVHHGADVISRVAFARAYPHGARELSRLLRVGIAGLLRECVAAAALEAESVRALAAAGNPTMIHSLLGLPLDGLGEAPFQGLQYDAWSGSAAALGLPLPESAEAWLLPGIASHVGSDAVAAVLATGIDLAERPRLLIDLGTNTEVVLGSRHGITCASAAAGPAFEGSVIRYGMRAVPGAIETVSLAGGDIALGTVGGEPAIGICGSGLIDAAAALLAAGIVEPSGRVHPRAELQELPAALRERVVEAEDGRAVRLGGSERRPVFLTAADVRELQLVKASIAAAVRLLLERSATSPHAVEAVLVAGAFGGTIPEASARALGLLPLPPDCPVRFVGNAAGTGARLALVDRAARDRAERVARRARVLELATDPAYQAAFVDALAFPEPRNAA